MTTDETKFHLTPYKRVLQLAHRPSKDEFLRVGAITGGFSVLVGLLGMLIYGLMLVIPG